MTSHAIEVQPIRHAVVVQRSVEDAFRLLTDGIASWWPLATHSYGGDAAETAVFEPGVGGRVYERQRDGTERLWAEVLVWEPPHRFVVAWHVCKGTEVEVRVTQEGEDARVELEHRGWERLPGESAQERDRCASGWVVVLARLADVTR